MVTCFNFLTLQTITYILISIADGVIIPVQYVPPRPLQCNNKHGFKVAQPCKYSERFGLVAKVWIGRADADADKFRSVDMMIDTGSYQTWVANYNTQVHILLENNTTKLVSWHDFTRKRTLFYNFQVENLQSSTEIKYADGLKVEVAKYSNQALLLKENNAHVLLTKMSLYLAEQLYTVLGMQAESGMLGLGFEYFAEEKIAFFTHYEHVPGNIRMMTFDLRWDHKRHMPLPSCFGIGQSVSTHSGPLVNLTADPFGSWKITVDYIEVVFPNTGGRYHASSVTSLLDTGTSGISLPQNLVNEFNVKEKEVVTNNGYRCEDIIKMLPQIYIRFRSSEGSVLEFKFNENQLYHIVDSDYCISSLLTAESMVLGTPFFSRAYIEMFWNRNHRDAVVIISEKAY